MAGLGRPVFAAGGAAGYEEVRLPSATFLAPPSGTWADAGAPVRAVGSTAAGDDSPGPRASSPPDAERCL